MNFFVGDVRLRAPGSVSQHVSRAMDSVWRPAEKRLEKTRSTSVPDHRSSRPLIIQGTLEGNLDSTLGLELMLQEPIFLLGSKWFPIRILPNTFLKTGSFW